MSERERDPETRGPGHRLKVVKKQKCPRKPKGPMAGKSKDLKAKREDPEARTPSASRKRRLPSMAGPASRVLAPFAKVVGYLKRVPTRLRGLWDRSYDNATDRPVRAVRIFAVVVAAIGVLGGLFWLQAGRYQRTELARVEATAAARDSVVALMSYNFRSIDRQVGKTQDLVTGSFKGEYAQFLNGSVAPGAKEKQVSVQTSVDSSAVVDSSPGEVVLLVYIDQQSEVALNPDAVTDSGLRGVRVTLEKQDDAWKVSELTPL